MVPVVNQVVMPMSEQINEDFQTAVSMTGFASDQLYVLESTPTRITALMKLCKGTFVTDAAIELALKNWQGLEILILEGSCNVDDKLYVQGGYLRLPDAKRNNISAASDCILFVKFNQFLSGDNGDRCIDTRIADEWLPGPVEGIEIRPLHVFDTESIMLLKWHHAAEFKPGLNPKGEEIMVVNGLLQNRDQLYRQYSWIRKPVEDWCRWHGNTGTLVYYKSGHFPDDPR